MHRMRRFLVLVGLAVSSITFASQSASAALLKPNADRSFPDISADINGKVNYTYDSSAGNGLFNVTNTPYLIAGGPTSNLEFNVQPDANGIRQQILNVALDSSGNILANDPRNSYQLFGSVTANGQTFTGLLLQGKATAFGSQDLGSLGIQGTSIFDVNLNITGGALAAYFGADAYMRITPELQSTFTGLFNTDFSAVKATSNTRAYHSPSPFPVPEPATLIVLLAGSAGMVVRHRRRLQVPRG
jgi:PEP-CTERM motif